LILINCFYLVTHVFFLDPVAENTSDWEGIDIFGLDRDGKIVGN
jgi:hypothetical protein